MSIMAELRRRGVRAIVFDDQEKCAGFILSLRSMQGLEKARITHTGRCRFKEEDLGCPTTGARALVIK